MRARPSPALLSLALTAVVASVALPSAAQKSQPAPAATGPRKDAEGKTGIAPYTELIMKGQAAFVARDIPGAITAFQDAIKLDPAKMLGFVRLGEAMLESGNVAEAESAWTTALGKKGADDLQAKALFCLADLRERQKNWQASKEAWGAYATFLSGKPKAVGYPATAADRQKQIDRRVKDEKDYGAVKERIAAREGERLKEAEENAKKDKLNR